MLRRRQISGGPGRRKLRSSLARASTPVHDIFGAIEEHVVWRIADLLRGFVDVVRWPLERLIWTAERWLVWPLQERAAGWGAPPRATGAGALAAAAIGAVAIGVVLLDGGEGGERQLPTANPVVAAAPAPSPAEAEPSGPVLHGVAPKFGVGDEVGVATTNDESGGAAAADVSPTASDDAGAADEASEGEGGATTSSEKPVPAGPEAMKVARRFSEAFVFYEIGERPARAATVFEETATPQLATALAERPPRQPASAEVPKARVLNLVPGPRRGKVYTVSASLLRVGVTSELRLKLTKQAGAWLITDVRG
jgi:hypothetical protein